VPDFSFVVVAVIARGCAARCRKAIAAGLLQATSFSFVIVATQIGLQLHIMVQATATALVGAGLISVVTFPAIAFALLGDERRKDQDSPGEEAAFATGAIGS
jgi:Kef-type K+ transport system membrane component KefB